MNKKNIVLSLGLLASVPAVIFADQAPVADATKTTANAAANQVADAANAAAKTASGAAAAAANQVAGAANAAAANPAPAATTPAADAFYTVACKQLKDNPKFAASCFVAGAVIAAVVAKVLANNADDAAEGDDIN